MLQHSHYSRGWILTWSLFAYFLFLLWALHAFSSSRGTEKVQIVFALPAEEDDATYFAKASAQTLHKMCKSITHAIRRRLHNFEVQQVTGYKSFHLVQFKNIYFIHNRVYYL